MTSAEPAPADTRRAALLLSNRLTRLAAAPLKAREFWALLDRTDALGVDVGQLLTDPARCDSVATDEVPADRLRALLDATRAFAFEVERLEESGVHLLSALDDRFPPLLRDRMHHGCPPHLFAAGALDVLAMPTLSIVGEGNEWAQDAARRAVAATVVAGWSVTTPESHPQSSPESSATSDTAAAVLAEALACEASTVILASAGINQVARRPEIRRRVQDAAVCLVSPFAPDAGPNAAAVRARDSMLHAISTLTLVVACADGTGATWAAAFDAVQREPRSVVTVVGPEASAGNHALADLGAHALDSVDELYALLV